MARGSFVETAPTAHHSRRERGKSLLYIGQILQEQLCNIGVDVLSVRHWRVSMNAASRPWFFSLARGTGELAKQKTVAEIPGHTWKLPCTIGCSRHSLSKL